QKDQPYDLLACRIDHQTHSLRTVLEDSCKVELLDFRSDAAYRMYEAALSFIYTLAVEKVYGKEALVSFENSLSHGLFTTIRGVAGEISTEKIMAAMAEIVAQNLPFIGINMDRGEIISYLEARENTDDLRLLRSAPDIHTARLYTLDGRTELCFHDLVPSTGYVKYYEVVRYKSGFLLRFPRTAAPTEMPPFADDAEKLYDAFAENTRWGRLAGVSSAMQLNETIASGNVQELILLCEALQERKIAEIASRIHNSGKRFVLIAGPSSSGKTTFAKRLSIQLRVLGVKPLYLGTDDYFKERDETPLNPDGSKDFESLAALDLDLFSRQMNDLLDGREVDLPLFDFQAGTKRFGNRIVTIDSTQPIIMEGIHALNPEMTAGIDDSKKFRIYISPLTQLNIDPHNRISTTDARMLRRIVRDHQFRGWPADTTIMSWDKVRAGERVNIFPYTKEADVFFNSHLLYELPVLKKYAAPLLKEIERKNPAYGEARRILDFLDFFAELEDSSGIPNNSIMREFIGGSVVV
ncbi:MAG: hypothetical protein IKE06_01245, partial [Solobacterium sp.]|nr:hypothetical protein [Solobacterium sp.]